MKNPQILGLVIISVRNYLKSKTNLVWRVFVLSLNAPNNQPTSYHKRLCPPHRHSLLPKLVLLPLEQDEVQVEVVQLRSVRILAAATRLITAAEVSMMTVFWAHYVDNAT